jgi:quinol monooxygenase YgiN
MLSAWFENNLGINMLLIVGTVRLPPENLSKARPIMEAMVTSSRAEDGCEEYCYAEDVLEPGLIHIKEMWRDQQALDGHFATEHIAAWRAAWPALGIGDRNLRIYEVGQPRQT